MNTNKIYLYLKVSTIHQNVELHKDELLLKVNELKLNKNDVIFIEETISGMKNIVYGELGKIKFENGDVFITSEVSRIGPNTVSILNFLKMCLDKNVKVYFTKSNFTFDDTITSQMMIFAYNISAQIEREMISQRTRDALARKKNDGFILGRPKGDMVLDNKKNEIIADYNSGLKIIAIATKNNCRPCTIGKLLKKYNIKKSKKSKNIEKSKNI